MKHSKALLVAPTVCIVVAFCIGALVGALFVQAQTSLSIQYLMGGIYPGAPAYTIFQDASRYLAKNAHGQIDFSGTNASQVFQDTFDALGTYGGEVFITAGLYTITHKITIPPGVPIKVSGERGHFSSWLRCSSAGGNVIFECPGASGYGNGAELTLEDLHFDGNGAVVRTAGNDLVRINYTWNSQISRCVFGTGGDNGLAFYNGEYATIYSCAFFQNNGNGFIAQETLEVYITNCESFENEYSGYLYAGTNLNCLRITSSRALDNTQHGVSLWGCQYAHISGCDFRNNDYANTASYDGVYVAGDATHISREIYIGGCWFSDNDRYQVELQTFAYNCLVTGNFINGTDYVAPWLDAGTNNSFHHNWNGTHWADGV